MDGSISIATGVASPPIRLVVGMLHKLDGDLLRALLNADHRFYVTRTLPCLEDALAACSSFQADVLILDAMMLDDRAAWDADPRSSMKHPVPVLLLDIEVNDGHLAAALKLPAAGYATRRTPFPELAEGILRLTIGQRAFDSAARHSLRETPNGDWELLRPQQFSLLSSLTQREKQVLRLIAQGKTVRACAADLALSPSTVDNHKSRIMKKLGVHKVQELTRLAIRGGLIHCWLPLLIILDELTACSLSVGSGILF